MKDVEIILLFFIIFLTFANLSFLISIGLRARDGDEMLAVINFIKNLFINRNIFGVILGLFYFIIAIPAILLVLFGEIIMWLIVLVAMVWNLGNKNAN